jgi:hypothetical protein
MAIAKVILTVSAVSIVQKFAIQENSRKSTYPYTSNLSVEVVGVGARDCTGIVGHVLIV